jgi:transposase
MKLIKFSLLLAEQLELERIVRFHENWRIRERASTILLLSQGLSCVKVAEKMGLSRPTVESTRRNWFAGKFQSLPDLPRTGAPLKINPDESERILKLVDEKPLSATDVLKIHLENNGATVHVATIRALLKRNDRSWKRTRHSLKKKEMRKPSKMHAATLLFFTHEQRPERLYLHTWMRRDFRVSIQIETHGQKLGVNI